MPLNSDTPCIIGRDFLPTLGFRLTHVTSTTAKTMPGLNVSPTLCVASRSSFSEESPLPPEVSLLIDANLAIPSSSRCSHPDSVIPLDTADSAPVFRRPYRMPAALTEKVDIIVKDWLQDGVIEVAPAGCRWNSPLLAVGKHPSAEVPNPGPRVCMDPRPINAILRSGDEFPIPIINELLDRFAGACIFSSLDLKAGYNQFTIKKEDHHKLAFFWEGIQYNFIGAPFGLKHLSSAYQRVLSSIFADLAYVIVYIDNIYVFSDSRSNHVKHLCEVLTRLNKWRLRLNIIKCLLFQLEVLVLGFIISSRGVLVDHSKLIGLSEVPIP